MRSVLLWINRRRASHLNSSIWVDGHRKHWGSINSNRERGFEERKECMQANDKEWSTDFIRGRDQRIIVNQRFMERDLQSLEDRITVCHGESKTSKGRRVPWMKRKRQNWVRRLQRLKAVTQLHWHANWMRQGIFFLASSSNCSVFHSPTVFQSERGYIPSLGLISLTTRKRSFSLLSAEQERTTRHTQLTEVHHHLWKKRWVE